MHRHVSDVIDAFSKQNTNRQPRITVLKWDLNHLDTKGLRQAPDRWYHMLSNRER